MAHCSKHRFALASLALLLLLATSAFAGEVAVYIQNPDYLSLYASQNDTSGTFGAFATAYDNFTLGSATNINLVYWAGGYYNPQSAGTITAWTVNFYANNAGQPGALLSSFSIAGNANETFVQNDALGDPVYFYHTGVSFNAAAGTQYWLSVVPDLAFPPQWGWTSSSKGDGISYQDYFGTRLSNPTDLAFALYTAQSTVPEPGSLLLLGSAVLGAAGMLRRKFKG